MACHPQLLSFSGGSEAIDSWMQAPFHAVGLLQERLKSVGFDSEFNPTTGLYEFGMNIFGKSKSGRSRVLTFPGKGSYSRMDSFQGESPDSRKACGPNWQKCNGLPIWVSLLTSPPSQMTAQLIPPIGKMLKSGGDLCIVNERNFVTTDPVDGSAGKAIIRSEHLVMIIPKKSLAPGLQKMSLSMTGRPIISWSFTVIGAPPTIKWTSAGTAITWSKPPTQLQNPIRGYEVMIGDSLMKVVQSFRVTTPPFITTNLVPAEYFVCVRAIGKYRNGNCSIFSSYTVKSLP